MIIPLLKSTESVSKLSDNYRVITISPCISKVFELCLNDKFADWLRTDHLQFGFRTNKGCHDTILTLQGVVKHINHGGSTAVLCALDISKTCLLYTSDAADE